MIQVEDYFNELLARVCALEAKFIEPFFPVNPLVQPSAYELEVRAYCVLAHAALEEFVERTVLNLMSEAIDAWLDKRTYSDVLVTLVAYYGVKLIPDDDDSLDTTKVFDHLRKLFNTARDRFSKDVSQNHGASLKYLRKLLVPVAVDITDDVAWLNSLQQLAKERGDYAHKTGSVQRVLAPEDARRYVFDALVICDDIRAKVREKAAQF